MKILILLLIAVLSGCDSKNKDKLETVIYNATVREAISQYETALDKKRNEIVFEKGIRANNCESYIKASKALRIGAGVNNQIIKSEYLVCDVLLLVGDTKFIISKTKSNLGKTLAERVDLRSFSSSHFQMLDEKKHTLTKLSKNLKISDTSAGFESDDWFYSLELVAVTDVNKNGKPDWVVWFIDNAKVGNYRGYQTLVAYDVDTSENLIRLQTFPN